MLGYFLPQATTAAHCNVARVGLDALEAIGLLATGHLMARGDRRYAVTATLTGTALMVDAWFDSSPRLPGATDHDQRRGQAYAVDLTEACEDLAGQVKRNTEEKSPYVRTMGKPRPTLSFTPVTTELAANLLIDAADQFHSVVIQADRARCGERRGRTGRRRGSAAYAPGLSWR